MFTKELTFKPDSTTKLEVSYKDFNVVNGGVFSATLYAIDEYVVYLEEEPAEDVDEAEWATGYIQPEDF